LAKRDVEQLLAVLDGPPPALTDEVDALRAALTTALRRVLGDADATWCQLVDASQERGGWPERRAAALLSEDAATAREAMWELAAELNEVRDITPGL
jgi:hypothetical protein